MIRINDKVTDQRNPEEGTKLWLSPEQRRSRIEVVFRHGVLQKRGLLKPGDLARFRFPKLRRRVFDFKQPAIRLQHASGSEGKGLAETEQAAFRRGGIMAFDCVSRRENLEAWADYEAGTVSKKPDDLGKKGYTIVFDDLARAADNALQNLHRKWKRELDQELKRARATTGES